MRQIVPFSFEDMFDPQKKLDPTVVCVNKECKKYLYLHRAAKDRRCPVCREKISYNGKLIAEARAKRNEWVDKIAPRKYHQLPEEQDNDPAIDMHYN